MTQARILEEAARPAKGPLGLVLTGGGARGAYQVGVLKWLARKYPHLETPILTGVSAGAINAATLAQLFERLGERIAQRDHGVADAHHAVGPGAAVAEGRFLAVRLEPAGAGLAAEVAHQPAVAIARDADSG